MFKKKPSDLVQKVFRIIEAFFYSVDKGKLNLIKD